MTRLVLRFVAVLFAAVLAVPPAAGAAETAQPSAGPVLVVGGTGRTGRLVMAQLREAGVTVIGSSRDVSKAATPGEYQWRTADVTKPHTLPAALEGIRQVVFVASATIGASDRQDPRDVDYIGVKNLADAARGSNVDHVVLVSAVGVTSPERIPMPPLREALKWKLAGEEYLRGSGLPYTILRPGRLVDKPSQPQALFFDQGDRVTAAVTSRADLARAIVQAVLDPASRFKTAEVFNFDTGWPIDWPVTYADLRRDKP